MAGMGRSASGHLRVAPRRRTLLILNAYRKFLSHSTSFRQLVIERGLATATQLLIPELLKRCFTTKSAPRH